MTKLITTLIVLIILQQEDVPVQLEALDILSDLLSRFGSKSTTLSSLSEPTTRHLLICFKCPVHLVTLRKYFSGLFHVFLSK